VLPRSIRSLRRSLRTTHDWLAHGLQQPLRHGVGDQIPFDVGPR